MLNKSEPIHHRKPKAKKISKSDKKTERKIKWDEIYFMTKRFSYSRLNLVTYQTHIVVYDLGIHIQKCYSPAWISFDIFSDFVTWLS